MDIAILSNVNVDLLAKKVARMANVFTPDGYGVWVQELLDKNSKLYQASPVFVFAFLDARELFSNLSYADCLKEIKQIQAYFEQAIETHPVVKFFIADLDYPENVITSYATITAARKIEILWTQMLMQLEEKYSNMYIFKLKDLISEVGRSSFYSRKLWYLGGIKFSGLSDSLIADQIERILLAHQGVRKKCLLLDLDNTLWGGVVGELGANGIELSAVKEGSRFKDFQQRIKEMKEAGVILGIVSKNNWDDIREVFATNKNMVLKEEDFAAIKVNWKDKIDNIKEIAGDLNIGLESMVFIDDNPVEREAVKQLIPEITVPDFPKDTTGLESFIKQVWNDYFFVLDIVREDMAKTAMYLQNSKRVAALKSIGNMEEYLKTLDTIIKIWQARPEDIERISQLTQKTNQFNLTTKRYQEEEIRSFMDSPLHYVFVASVEDRYGDSGKVAVIILEKDDVVKVDSFLMSCRVMGRKIEDQLVDYIESFMIREGQSQIVAYYRPTVKNKPVQDLFDRLGYEIIRSDESGNKTYLIELSSRPKRVQYARLVQK